MPTARKCPLSKAQETAQNKLYAIAGGSIDSGNVSAARITQAQRIAYIQSKEFRAWVAAEKAAGNEVFWLKDVDKTQASGDIFTHFFRWRAANGKFSPAQLAGMKRALGRHAEVRRSLGIRTTRPEDVLRLWESKEQGGEGLGLLDFWNDFYWPSQIGLTRRQKAAQVKRFIPSYRSKVYVGVAEENRLLESLGVHVVIVSNGDQELAIGASEALGIKPENVVGSHLIYEGGTATGVNHSYEIMDDDWTQRPQGGKPLSFHYWVHVNRARFGWNRIDDRKLVYAGRDGDSASADGGMMILLKSPVIGNFMVDTPGEPQRLAAFLKIASKYGWTPGQFITLAQEEQVQA